MTETIISALISAAAAITVCVISSNKVIALIEYRLKQLEEKVDLHNNAVERLYIVERKLEVDEEKIRVSNHRIDDLEHFHKP